MKDSEKEEFARLDLRRQAQISNQVDAINRLLYDGSTYDDEMRILHEKLATVQEERDHAQRERDALIKEFGPVGGGKS